MLVSTLPASASRSLPSPPSGAALLDPAAGSNRAARLPWSNWAGTVRCVPSYFHTPRSTEEIRTVVAFASEHGHRVRVVGYGHSPGSIVDASDVLPRDQTQSQSSSQHDDATMRPVSSSQSSLPVHLLALGVHYRALESVDTESRQVTVQTGMSLLELNALLDERGLALSALGSISDQTVGGALACGTHGSSTGAHALLAAYVVRLELMDASGRVWRCSASEHPDLFNAARVSLGCLGVLTRVTLQCEAAYDLVERSCAITFSDLTCPDKFRRMVLEDPHADFVRFHWIPHTDRVVYTRMEKVYGAHSSRDSVVAERAAQGSALAGYMARVRAWKDRMVGFHMLQALYYVSTFGNLDRTMVPAIARLYTRLVHPPPGPPFPPAATAAIASALPSLATAASASAGIGVGAPSASPSSSPLPVALPTPAAGFTRQDRHDRILNFDCLFAQYVTEWAVDQERTVEALKAVRAYIEAQQLRVHFPIELRFSGGARPRKHDPRVAHSDSSAASVATASSSESDQATPAATASVGGDGIWLSPCYARAQSWIGIIMYRPYGKDVKYRDYFRGFEMLLNDTPERDPVLVAAVAAAAAAAEAAGAPPMRVLPPPTRFNGKPHWAKNVVMPLDQIDLQRLYPRWNDFKALRDKIDPQRLFSNTYIHELLDGGVTTTATATSNAPRVTLPLPSQL